MDAPRILGEDAGRWGDKYCNLGDCKLQTLPPKRRSAAERKSWGKPQHNRYGLIRFLGEDRVDPLLPRAGIVVEEPICRGAAGLGDFRERGEEMGLVLAA